MFNYPAMWEMGAQQREAFRARAPFPHIVMDGFLSEELLRLAVAGFPSPGSEDWRRTDNEHTHNKHTPSHVMGSALVKELRFSGEARAVFHELNSGLFLFFLRQLTGIDHLISDPYYIEGGYHLVGNGGRLAAHADFSHHSYLKLERRLNLLIYLNDNWKPEYGGALKLYAKDMTPSEPIHPVMNRAVIFETSETSYHGHPEPMTLPEGVWRRSIALYYYTMPRAERMRHKAIFPEMKEAACLPA